MADTPKGLSRFHSYMVVERKDVEFPSVCLKCGNDTTSTSEYTCNYFPRLERSSRYVRSVAGIIMAVTDRRSCVLTIPICDKCRRKPKSSGNLGAGIGLAFWALAAAFFAYIGIVGGEPDDPMLIGAAIASVICFALGLIVILIGWGLQHGGKKWMVTYLDEELVVMPAVHKDLLETLPEWQGKNVLELQGGL